MIIIACVTVISLFAVFWCLRETDIGYRDPQASNREYLELISEESRRKDEI